MGDHVLLGPERPRGQGVGQQQAESANRAIRALLSGSLSFQRTINGAPRLISPSSSGAMTVRTGALLPVTGGLEMLTGLKPVQLTCRSSARAPQQASDEKPKAKRPKPVVAASSLDFRMSEAPLIVPCGSGLLNSQRFNSARATMRGRCWSSPEKVSRRHNSISQTYLRRCRSDHGEIESLLLNRS